MKKTTILWTDDEIDLLKPHVIFLESKGYCVITATNGNDAIKLVEENKGIDLIFLDENMPGLSGIETLNKINTISPNIPVIMITKSEEENIMDQAIGSKIADYLIKPVNPNQILLSIKKNIDTKRLITQKTSSNYQAEFTNLGLLINDAKTYDDWTTIYKKLVYWELELENSDHKEMHEILNMQKADANKNFSKFIKKNYEQWFDTKVEKRPVLSPSVFQKFVFPLLDNNEKVIFILVDNLRWDQWKLISSHINNLFSFDQEEIYYSIVPTATQYSRNAMFAGLMPHEINKLYPHLWVHDEEEESKNLHEEVLLKKQIERLGKKYKLFFEKVKNFRAGKKLVDNFNNLINYDLSVLIYNFVDTLSHSRTEMEVIKELAYDESAYRSLTLSWFQHSNLLELLKLLSTKKTKVIITTDHGSIRVNNPIKVVGDKKTSVNLRYKLGKHLDFNPKEVYASKDPEKIHLPKTNFTSTFIFATKNDYMIYPNNYAHYMNYYMNTFQHGGISLEEMLIPFIILSNS